ncbi:MAG: hypothetical protein ABGY75_13360 [Gemmataceae bacterium]
MPTVSIPETVHRQLAEKAAEQNTTVDELVARLLTDDLSPRPNADRWVDAEYHAECAADTTPVPTLAEVRAILAKLPGSLAADVIADREDR